MFERVSRQVESSPCCDWGTPSSVYALHARNGAMFGPVEIGDSSTHQGALPCGASRFGLVNDGACAFADGWTARSTASRERRRFRAVPPCRMPRPRPHEQGASAAVSREAGDPRIGDGATALWGGVGRGDAVRQNSRSASPAPVTRHRPSEKPQFGPQGTKRSTSFQETPATHHEFDQGALIMSSNLCDDFAAQLLENAEWSQR